MAERRMFAKTIIDSDAFLDMPLSAQALYFHLSMRADDEGFINNPKKIQRIIGASDDDLKILIAKSFIIPFESGIVVIKHWKIHNYIRGDRLVSTKYTEERALLDVKENGAYTFAKEIEHLEKLDSKDMRKMAYKRSSLPYSFEYKIKRAFVRHKCPICGCEMGYSYKQLQPTIQHNIPISKGGLHEIENISVICLSCNLSIRDKETDSLNNKEVVETWDRIVTAEKECINWFNDPKLLYDSRVTDKCQSNVSIGKDSIGKVSIGNKYILSDSEDENAKAKIVIDYLNQKTGKAYRYSETSLKHIRARLKDHFTVEDCKKVIDNKVTSWKGTKYEQYLRPETLFTGKFETYLNEKPIKNQKVLPQYMDDDFDITQTEEFKELERELNDDNAENE